MPNKPQCVVICGGMGRRLAPLTTHKAKSMVEVKGQPIIKYIVDYWREFVVVKKKRIGRIYTNDMK